MIDFDSNVCLVYKVFNDKFSDMRYVEDDLIQEGMIGLWRACQSFDDSKGVKFSTYATKCIFRAMRDFARKERSHAMRVSSLDAEIDKDRGDDTFITLVGTSADEELDSQIELDEIISRLKKTDAWVIIKMKLEGMTQTQIAKELKISEASVSERLAAAYRKVRAEY